MDIITSNGIKSFSDEKLKNKINIEIEKIVTSTNSTVKALGAKGEKEGYLLISESQTSGRGRLGRNFYSPEGTGVYMSLLLRPKITPENTTLITTAAAVSVCNALERLGVASPEIKWVNDIFVNGKKVCGILTEGSINGNGKTEFAVLGVGVNIYTPKGGFPKELESIANGIFSEEKENLRNKFIAYFIESFYSFYENLTLREFITEYEQRCFVIGEKVSFMRNNELVKAKAIGIDENCGLKVITEDGRETVLSSGEVSLQL